MELGRANDGLNQWCMVPTIDTHGDKTRATDRTGKVWCCPYGCHQWALAEKNGRKKLRDFRDVVKHAASSPAFLNGFLPFFNQSRRGRALFAGGLFLQGLADLLDALCVNPART
jgi:hypothetical protein